MTPAIQTLPIAVPGEVLDFAVAQGVADCLAAVLEMTSRIFPGGLREAVVEGDPEIADDRHIVVVVKAKNLDVEQGLEKRWEWHGGLFACCPAPRVCVFRLDLSIAP
jgi:hypothetical protein